MITPKFVRCVDTGKNRQLTVGRTYQVIGLDSEAGGLYIINNAGYKAWYYQNQFLAEYGAAQEIQWDYAVADELQRKAHAAIDEYNAYIERKPETLYMKLFK